MFEVEAAEVSAQIRWERSPIGLSDRLEPALHVRFAAGPTGDIGIELWRKETFLGRGKLVVDQGLVKLLWENKPVAVLCDLRKQE